MNSTRLPAVDRVFEASLLGLLTSGYLAVLGSGYLDTPTAALTGIGLLLRACHPIPSAGVTVLSGLLALALGQPPAVAALAAVTVGFSQLSIGWANDVIDAGRDRTVGRPDKPLVERPDLVGFVRVAAWIAAALTAIAALAWG